MFAKYVGIDYSGAQTPEAGLPGLRVYAATPRAAPRDVLPAGPTRHWSRRGAAAWLLAELAGEAPVIVGIDHSFSFPRQYFQRYRLPRQWPGFLDDFTKHWPTDRAGVTVDDIRAGRAGTGARRTGKSVWRRLAEERARAKSVFHFDVPGSVAKSTHAGLPWLREVRRVLGERVHFWPYDGWIPPAGRSVVVEAYPSMYRAHFAHGGRTQDQQDAYAIAAWLRREDAAGRLPQHFAPDLPPVIRRVAAYEGWILGVE